MKLIETTCFSMNMRRLVPLQDEDVLDERVEQHVVKAQRMPNVPNADEVAAHSVTHEQGLRGRSWSILQAQHDALTVGDFDYGNMGHHNDGMPLLIEKSRSTGGFCAAAVPSARHPWPVNTFEHRLSLAGHKRKVMSSDGGSSILAWKAQVAYALARSYGIEVVLEEQRCWWIRRAMVWQHAVREVKART